MSMSHRTLVLVGGLDDAMGHGQVSPSANAV